ncbi:hypothetical protein QL285_006964 [Trifolium repens]|nr:hypothetical protein QL285_006964 [Trifolium repens]
MAFHGYFTLFLLLLCFLSTTSQGPPRGPRRNNVTVRLVNELPNDTLGPLKISCNNEATTTINVNGVYQQSFVNFERYVVCNATWSQMFSNFVAYDGWESPEYAITFCHDYLHFDKLICNASWGQLLTSFDAYNVPPGDDPAQYKTTYCNAREDGIYHSFYRHEERKLIATWKHK